MSQVAIYSKSDTTLNHSKHLSNRTFIIELKENKLQSYVVGSTVDDTKNLDASNNKFCSEKDDKKINIDVPKITFTKVNFKRKTTRFDDNKARNLQSLGSSPKEGNNIQREELDSYIRPQTHLKVKEPQCLNHNSEPTTVISRKRQRKLSASSNGTLENEMENITSSPKATSTENIVPTWKFGPLKGKHKLDKTAKNIRNQGSLHRCNSLPSGQCSQTSSDSSQDSQKRSINRNSSFKQNNASNIRQHHSSRKLSKHPGCTGDEGELGTIADKGFSISENYRYSELVLNPALLHAAMSSPVQGPGTAVLANQGPNAVDMTPLQSFRLSNQHTDISACPISNVFEGELLGRLEGRSKS